MADITAVLMDTKQASPRQFSPTNTESANNSLDDVVDHAVPEKNRGTDQDKHDMIVQGKKQEMRRNFKLLTMTGFASMIVCAWEGMLPLFNYVLLNGGTALIFWGYLCVAFSMKMAYLNTAEISSM